MPIGGQVGAGKANAPADLTLVQTLLARHAAWLAPGSPPAITGTFDDATGAAITKFQRDPGALLTPDGVVDPGGFTIRWLSRDRIPQRQHPVFVDGPVSHIQGAPSDADYDAAARQLGCEVAAIMAVSQVETGIRGCWEADGRPVILFERHYFSRLTAREFDRIHPDIANPVAGGYGLYSAQHPKLRRAAALNEEAALKSASWGGYQVMGANHASAGFATVAAFVSAQMESERRQLDCFVAVVLANNAWLTALQKQDWTAFASGYNGPGFRANDYDTKMADAYRRLAPPPPPQRPGQRPAGAPGNPPPTPPSPTAGPRTSTRGL